MLGRHVPHCDLSWLPPFPTMSQTQGSLCIIIYAFSFSLGPQVNAISSCLSEMGRIQSQGGGGDCVGGGRGGGGERGGVVVDVYGPIKRHPSSGNTKI